MCVLQRELVSVQQGVQGKSHWEGDQWKDLKQGCWSKLFGNLDEEHSRQREQQEQRSWGGSMWKVWGKEANVTGVEWRVVRIVASGDFIGDCKHFGFTLSELGSYLRVLSEKDAQPESWELCFIWWTFLGLQAPETASQITLRDCSEEARREARIYRSFCNKRPGSQNIKGLLLRKENQMSQVKEFSAFLCMGRCKSLGSLKSLLWYAP